jgi:hypothetical protein
MERKKCRRSKEEAKNRMDEKVTLVDRAGIENQYRRKSKKTCSPGSNPSFR